jgi:hypothetical protein
MKTVFNGPMLSPSHVTVTTPPRHHDLGHLGPWLTTFTPILISLLHRLLSDHGCAALGIVSVRIKLTRL